MKEQIAIQKLLQARLAEIQRQNPQFSLRAFAQKVGVHVGALSYILNGKRNVSRTLAERIAKRLMLDPQERSEILRLFPEKRRYKKDGAVLENFEPRYLELSATQFKIAAEWEHFAVMSLLNCEDFKNDRAWIAKRLGLTETRAQQVLDRLIIAGLFHVDADGKITRSKKSYRTSDDIADVSMKKHHEQNLDLAKESLHRDSVQFRDFTTTTMAIDTKKISTAKELIRKFQDDLSDLLETGKQTEVYRLSVQLFPFTKLEKNGDPQ
jgi:uncharacterized protein (TIGR02147 family)